MTGCDEERERIRQSIAARVTRMTDAQRQATRAPKSRGSDEERRLESA
jgi:hypothetical protein